MTGLRDARQSRSENASPSSHPLGDLQVLGTRLHVNYQDVEGAA